MRLEAVDASLKAYFDGFRDRLDDAPQTNLSVERGIVCGRP
jgi:hypothetical protein